MPTQVIPTYEELDRDLKLLALQQQKMLAEMAEKQAEEEQYKPNIEGIQKLRGDLGDDKVDEIYEREKQMVAAHEKKISSLDVSELKCGQLSLGHIEIGISQL